jgi:transcriptional regulator with XRE-family HTH domain
MQATDFFEQIGPTLIMLRARAGLSAASVARMARVGKSQISKYEKGKESPKFPSLARILDALNVEPLTFFYYLHAISRGVTDERLRIELTLIESGRKANGLKVTGRLLTLNELVLVCLTPDEEGG